MDFPGGSDGKASVYNAGDLGSILGSGRSAGEGNGNSLQYSCLENTRDGGAWWAAVYGVSQSWTRLKQLSSSSSSSRLIITFVPRSKRLLMSWLQVTIFIDSGVQENKVPHCFHFLPIICHEVMGLDVMIFFF